MVLGSASVALVQVLAPLALGARAQHSSLSLSMGQIFGPLTPCSCLTTCLSLSWDVGTQVTGARGTDHSGFFLLDRGIVGSWVPVPALCQGASAQGLESPQNDRTACSNVFTSWYPCCNSIWRFHLLSSRKKQT